MNSVFKLSSSRLALLAAFGLAASFTPVAAADLGGDCCADLEERVAELEATTARKGNRKVSLTISGWVNEEVLLWDDGTERNAYVGTNKLEQTRVRFVGEAKIVDGWSAGYTLELGTVDHDSTKWDQISPGGSSGGAAVSTNDNLITVRKSNWWIKSKDYGKVTVGLEGTALYHLLDDADIANTRNFADAQSPSAALPSFFLRSGGIGVGNGGGGFGTGLKWSDIIRGTDNGTDAQTSRRNVVRYDSPLIAGFVATASWGEDDMWGVSLTYTNTWGDFKVIGKAGYGRNSDELTEACSKSGSNNVGPNQDCELWGAAGSVMHVPTGLYVYGAYGQNHDNIEKAANPLADPTDTQWYIQAGIEQKWLPLGKTTIFGDYRHDDGGSNLNKSTTGTVDSTHFVQSSNIDFWGAGVIQNVEPAAMDLYVIYRHADGDIANTNGGTTVKTTNLDAFDLVQAGALIKF